LSLKNIQELNIVLQNDHGTCDSAIGVGAGYSVPVNSSILVDIHHRVTVTATERLKRSVVARIISKADGDRPTGSNYALSEGP